MQARGFYAILAIATILGVALNFTSIVPIKALFWSAVINGVIAVPIMAVMMLMSARSDVMGPFTVTRRLQVLGWACHACHDLSGSCNGHHLATVNKKPLILVYSIRSRLVVGITCKPHLKVWWGEEEVIHFKEEHEEEVKTDFAKDQPGKAGNESHKNKYIF